MKKLFFLAAALPLYESFSQDCCQIGFGFQRSLNTPDIKITFDRSTRVFFEHVTNDVPRVSFMLNFPVNDAFFYQIGLEGQPRHFHAEIFIFQDDPSKSQRLIKGDDYVHLMVPVKAGYRLTHWLYFNAGLGLDLLANARQHDPTAPSTLSFGLTPEEKSAFLKVIDDRVRPFGLSFHLGLQFFYRKTGLQVGMNRLLTGGLRPFSYDGKTHDRGRRHGDYYLQLVHRFQWDLLSRKPGRPEIGR